jgi:hypothetical protein
MSRVLLQYLLPLLLPTLLWTIWWFTFGRKRVAADGTSSTLSQGPWFWLILGGLALAGVSLVYTALTHGFTPTGTYVPPRWEDGHVVPGRVE